MTRELNQLIKKLKVLPPDEIARVQQFLLHLKSPELRAVPAELKAVAGEAWQAEAAQANSGEPSNTDGIAVPRPAAASQNAIATDAVRSNHDGSSPEAAVAHAACAQWRRRPFQAIDADDLQPIAALFREAVDIRATSRFRYGSR